MWARIDFDHSNPRKVGMGYINGIHKLIKNTYYSYVKKMKNGDHIQRDKTAANTKEATPQGAMFQGRTCSTKMIESHNSENAGSFHVFSPLLLSQLVVCRERCT